MTEVWMANKKKKKREMKQIPFSSLENLIFRPWSKIQYSNSEKSV